MRNTKSIPSGIKNLILKNDESNLSKIKTIVSNFRQTANNNIPIYPKLKSLEMDNTEFQDMLRYEYFDQLSDKTLPESHSRFLRERQSLFYVSKAAQDKLEKKELEQSKKLFNIADELNKKFKIKKVEAAKELKRTGMLGYKIGMTGVWDKFGTWHPLTVIKIDRCQIIAHKVFEKGNYYGMEVGCGEKKVKKTQRPLLGHFIKHGVPPKRDIKEFEVSKENLLPSGFVLTVRHFVPGQFVDIRGVSKGHGWAGVMKRWNFKGGVSSHGNSLNHRAGGSIGNREWPGKVWRGKKMAGRLGGENNTKQNIRVFKIDYERNLLFVIGSVPGNNNTLVVIKDAIKKQEAQFHLLHFPTFIEDPAKKLPSVLEWVGVVDRNEIFQHDNDEILGTSEEEEEGEPEKNAEDDMGGKK